MARKSLLFHDDQPESRNDCWHRNSKGKSRRPWKLHYMFLALEAVKGALVFWGLVSLGLQISSTAGTSRTFSWSPPCSGRQDRKMDGYHPETLPPGLSLCDCGTTIHQALSRNCTYDTLATAWLPPYCRDDELTAEFDKAGPGPGGSWEYFADEQGKVPLSRDEVAALGETKGTFWASRGWHIAHCIFYWQKYHRMRHTHVILEERFDSLHHVKHCGRLIRNPIPNHFFLIQVPVTMNSSENA